MSFNPYDQARDDARSGRMLTPGADPSVYHSERYAAEANRKAQAELEQRGKEPFVLGSEQADPPPASYAPVSPEEAQAGLVGCLVIPVVIALSPLYFAVYPLVALAALAAASATWQALQAVSPGGNFLNGIMVLTAFGVAVFAASRLEQRLERLPIYRMIRLPLRVLGFGILLVTALTATGRTAGCPRPETDVERMSELVTLLRAYYACVLSNPATVMMAAGAAVGLTLLAMLPPVRSAWHRGLQRLRLRAVR